MANSAAEILLRKIEGDRYLAAFLKLMQPEIDDWHVRLFTKIMRLSGSYRARPHTDDMRQMLDDLGIEPWPPEHLDRGVFKWK